MQIRFAISARSAASVLGCLLLAACNDPPISGHVLDEARRRAATPPRFPAADEDYFHDMDGGIALTPDEVKGRNMWIVWTGGNDRFWDGMTAITFGAFDLLKIVSYDPEQADRPRQALELSRPDQRALLRHADRSPTRTASACCSTCAQRRLPGRSVRERNRSIPASRSARAARPCRSGSYYGYADRHRRAAAVPQSRTSTRPPPSAGTPSAITPIPSYYNDKNLVRPYRVGMSCGFCHVGPSPTQSAGRPGASGMGQSELDRRRAVFLGRSALRL